VILTLDSKRRLTVPRSLAPVSPGDVFEAVFDPEEGELIFRRINQKEDWLEVLKQCPVTMDDIPERSREYPKKPNLG
jgi:hypothetical protein